MQLIRCTKKLQNEMGLKSSDLCAEEPRFSYFVEKLGIQAADLGA